MIIAKLVRTAAFSGLNRNRIVLSTIRSKKFIAQAVISVRCKVCSKILESKLFKKIAGHNRIFDAVLGPFNKPFQVSPHLWDFVQNTFEFGFEPEISRPVGDTP